MKKLFLVFILLCCNLMFSQYGDKDSNHIGLSGGITQLNLFSEQFKAKPEIGWVAGFSLRGNYYNNWQMIYGMQFTDSNFSLQSVTNTAINYKLSAVQVHLVASYMLIENHLTLEIGPVLQINGKLKVDSDKENLLLKDSPLVQAKDIVAINTFSGNVYGGVTVGFTNFRLNINYQYGFINVMNKLNKDDTLVLLNGNKDFKGNFGMLSGMLTIYL
ncbi:PorT family protein [Flavobacterium sp.]|uniref:PorT family protein n=1 Tax=Flavobacterium sp. TaxID=239 RepID=UPI0035287BE8